ncbi:hypothetical protein SZMC14600_04747 [Saccharomonospora azurea SZMC 14600]|nr:hypothetical protein SZMC14600_04747 [Saccharomonospora azurea SZMC 14600]
MVEGGGSGALGRPWRPVVCVGGGGATGGMEGIDAGGIAGTDGGDTVWCREDGGVGGVGGVDGAGSASSAGRSSLPCREWRGSTVSSSAAARRRWRADRVRPLDSDAPRSAACRASISATLMPPWLSSARRRFLSASSRLRCARARHSSA